MGHTVLGKQYALITKLRNAERQKKMNSLSSKIPMKQSLMKKHGVTPND